MLEDPTITSSHSRIGTTIRELLERDPVCLEIVCYLMRHSEAVDTARGIAEWWIRRDVASTHEALGKLLGCGVVRSHPVQDNTFVYGYTRNSILRQALTRYVQALTVPSGAGGA